MRLPYCYQYNCKQKSINQQGEFEEAPPCKKGERRHGDGFMASIRYGSKTTSKKR